MCLPTDIPTTSAAPATDATYESLEALLLNHSGQVSLAERFRALFSLKALPDQRSVDIIGRGFADSSALLKHELAYVLGQMGNPHALPVLEQVLRDDAEDVMVRHEAAEALGAIGQPESLPVLREFVNHPAAPIAETCELAVGRIQYEADQQAPSTATIDADAKAAILYASVDPAPAHNDASQSTEALGHRLMDPNLPLFERYRAMFALRNRGDTAAVEELARGLEDPTSALFRHEIGFVFGQMQHPASVPALVKALANTAEEPMVRHECAEALGSIASPEVLPVLQTFSKDPERVVRESCIVALDMYEHEQSGQFQYATVPDSQ
ncbi:deoxyhypusine hydroxylase [Dimargaris cristalligena]|uniref:Deoxyhypusine hydroxylase n=1 Tax=Dimargaris cristalligena TaxID=215637 RepID=A0A4Q0A0W0_9FUNG|nr:deoxyhypusine hydroxylase [Dimargaris cristalligena]RKP39736.1 MFBC-like protein [Dimargaris cristalligena]|eukprot:RKP39736.1 MFBC-like protein [Dimargaris cristalligena]